MKRFSAIILTLFACFFLAACSGDQAASQEEPKGDSSGKIQVVATIFPVYDFAREVGGDNVSVTKILPSGVESHSFEPSPSDVITINEADLFLYTGDTMEPWVSTVIRGADSDALSVGVVSKGVPLLRLKDEHDEDKEHEEHYDYDPHIWTDPARAMIMVDNITAYLSGCDPQHADEYTANAASYKKELEALDNKIKEIVTNGKRDEIIFGGRFAFLYFVDHYDLDYDAAVDSCSDHSEPSAKKIAEIITEIREDQIPVIYYEELTNPTVCQSIADDTGAKMLMLHSCHNVTEEELANGTTYLSLMEQNAENLKEGLN